MESASLSQNNDVTVFELLQKDADYYIKKFWRCWNEPQITVDFDEVFSEENKIRIESGKNFEVLWALPQTDRKYFLVSSMNSVYIFGVNQTLAEAIYISSFGRVSPQGGKALICLRAFIQEILHREGNKEYIITRLTSYGYKVFKKLKEELPKQIKEDIIFQPSNQYWSCKIKLTVQLKGWFTLES